MAIRIIDVPRERDDQVIEWLQLADEGMNFAEIGRRLGIHPYQTIATTVKRIRRDDAEEERKPK